MFVAHFHVDISYILITIYVCVYVENRRQTAQNQSFFVTTALPCIIHDNQGQSEL